MVNFSLLAAEIISLVWGTPANFNGFRVLASLLQRRRSTEANQTLHSVWSLPGLVHFRRLLLRNEILPGAKFTLHPPSLALSYWHRYCTAVEQWAHSAGRPSRWALAHILVFIFSIHDGNFAVYISAEKRTTL